MINETIDNNLEPQPQATEIQRFENANRNRAKKHFGTASQLIGSVVLDVEQDIRPLIETKNLKKMINNTKRGNLPTEPDHRFT